MNKLKHILNNLEFVIDFLDTMKGKTNKTPEQFERSLIAIEDAIKYLKCKEVKNK